LEATHLLDRIGDRQVHPLEQELARQRNAIERALRQDWLGTGAG
jgi:hypothetical protein